MLPYLILSGIILSVIFMSCFAVKRIEVWAERHFHGNQENSTSRLGNNVSLFKFYRELKFPNFSCWKLTLNIRDSRFTLGISLCWAVDRWIARENYERMWQCSGRDSSRCIKSHHNPDPITRYSADLEYLYHWFYANKNIAHTLCLYLSACGVAGTLLRRFLRIFIDKVFTEKSRNQDCKLEYPFPRSRSGKFCKQRMFIRCCVHRILLDWVSIIYISKTSLIISVMM